MKPHPNVVIVSKDGYGNATIAINGKPYEYKFPAMEILDGLRKKYWNEGRFLNAIDEYCTTKKEKNNGDKR